MATICFHRQEIAPSVKTQYSNFAQNVPLSRDQSAGLPVNMTWRDTNLGFYPLVLRDKWDNWFPHPSLNARLPTFSQTWKPRKQFPSFAVWRKVGGVFLWFRETDWCCRASHGSLFSDRLDSSTAASLRMQMPCGCSRHAVPWKDLHPPTYTPEWKESNVKLVGAPVATGILSSDQSVRLQCYVS